MASSKKLRKTLVKRLRECARQAGVEQVRDDASRKKVTEMAKAILTKASASTVCQVKEAFAEYEKTWQVADAKLCPNLKVGEQGKNPLRRLDSFVKISSGLFGIDIGALAR